jgi:NADH-quinone oxidoreductase subunit M
MMILLLLLILPAAVSLLLLTTRSRAAREIALFTSLVELTLSLILAFDFDQAAGVQFVIDQPWIASMGIRFAAGVDGISLMLVLLTTGLVPFILLTTYRKDVQRPSSFYGLILLMQAALVGVFTALDGFLFYIFWEMALIPIWFICLLWGGEGRARITFKFFIYTLAGSLVMLISLVYVYLHTSDGSFSMQSLYEAGRSLQSTEQSIIFWGLFVAFAIKMPVFPFHTWQPETYRVSPTQGTMLLSGIMLKMGLFGLIRWLIPVVPEGVQAWGQTAVILSVIGIVYASAIAMMQHNFKRLIAYSSIAHVGLIAAGIMTLSPVGMQGALIQMISHGIVVVALFFIVDIIESRTHTMQLAELGGIRTKAPVLASVFLVVMMGSVALPFTSGFVGEFLLINALVDYQVAVAVAAGLTIILGAVYMLRGFQRAMLGEVNTRTADFTDLSLHEKLVLYPLVIMIVVIGVYPKPLLGLSQAAVNTLTQTLQNLSATLN